MLYTISNDALQVQINDLGAQLWSICTADGTEYLWQGDPTYWPDRALNLFPQVGLCTDDTYTLHGRTYHLDIHGFVKDTVLSVAEHSPTRIVFAMEDTEQTRAMYPAAFRYAIAYTLQDNRLEVTITVENRGGDTMHFSVGGHPGFRLPLEEGLRYEDYRLQFPQGASARRVECTEGACLLTGEITDFPLTDGAIPLSHQLFARRVLILTDMPDQVTLCAAGGRRQVTVRYPQMPYLGVWKALGTDAPYVCIEPWTAPSAQYGVVEEFSSDPRKIHLPAGEQYTNCWSITVDG